MFETKCHFCDGYGTFYDDDAYETDFRVKCRDCEGRGYNPTELGRSLLEFLERHKFKPGEQ
jgi:excinuclease UvrABC ATPase subunit